MVQNAIKGGFRTPKQEKSKEQIEYEEATKNIKVLTTKLRLSQQGIDTSSMSRQDLDRVMALYDKMDAISADVRNKTAEIQRESNIEIQRINQKANEKYSQASKDIDVLINNMKKVEKITVDKIAQPTEQMQVQGETKEEIRQEISPDKVKEDIINTFAEKIIQKMRKEVINAFEDYGNMPQIKVAPVPTVPQVVVEQGVTPQIKVAPVPTVPQVVVGQGVVNKDTAIDIAIKVGQDMVEKSAKVDQGDKPPDKEIPIVSSTNP